VEPFIDYMNGKCKHFESEDILSEMERTPNKEKRKELWNKGVKEFQNILFPPHRTGFMSKSDDTYELLYLFPMKFNRLALYEGDLNHVMYVEDVNFWKTNERITSNYFVHIKWGLSPDGESVDDEFNRVNERRDRLNKATGGAWLSGEEGWQRSIWRL
jgi:hypothetical protein